MTEITIELGKLRGWRQALFEARMIAERESMSAYGFRRIQSVLREINDIIGDGEDVDHVSPRNEK